MALIILICRNTFDETYLIYFMNKHNKLIVMMRKYKENGNVITFS